MNLGHSTNLRDICMGLCGMFVAPRNVRVQKAGGAAGSVSL